MSGQWIYGAVSDLDTLKWGHCSSRSLASFHMRTRFLGVYFTFAFLWPGESPPAEWVLFFL